MTANPAQNKRNATLRLIVRLTVLVVVAFGMPDGHAATPDPVAEVITHQSFKVGSVEAAFTVTAATLPLADDKGEKQADIYYVAYTRDEAAGGSRPITFVFNGGTGLQLGLSPSRRAGTAGRRFRARRPGPVASRHTGGQSRQLAGSQRPGLRRSGRHGLQPRAAGDAARSYWGVEEDLASIATFIDRYLTQNHRQASPKYLVGESYGGFRAARLPDAAWPTIITSPSPKAS